MILRSWAERLLHVSGSPDVIDLHVKDVVAAFLTGLRTSDGQAIAQSHRGSTNRAELAAAVSAIARLSECDDIHLASCITPGAIVIPVALAFANDRGGNDFNRAVSAGYTAGIHIGAALGGAHSLARGIWPTLFAAPVMAAVTTSLLSNDDLERLSHAIGSAITGADGRVADPALRWTSLADAVSCAIRAAESAHRGQRGDSTRLPDGVDLDARSPDTSIATVGFKPFPIARQGANAVVAFQRLLAKGIDFNRIESIEVFVPAINVALLKRPVSATDRLSRLCNMGLQLAGSALAPDLLYDPERIAQADVLEFARRITVTPASDLDAHWPDRWAARLVVHSARDQYDETVIQAPFDHDAPGLRQLLEEKWRRMLPAKDLTLLDHGQSDGPPYATLWQQIERRLTTPAED